jgi:hypothetical protein
MEFSSTPKLSNNGCICVNTEGLEDLLVVLDRAKVILSFRMQFYLPVHQCSLRKDFAIFPVGVGDKTPFPVFLDVEIESDFQVWPQR